MKPQEVKSSKFFVEDVIYDRDGFSIAVGTGDGSNEDEKSIRRFAMRWNGADHQKGFPTSNSHPMWFQLSTDIKGILETLLEHSDVQIKS